MARAAIVTIGNELVSGDIENTNGSWLARRLAALGVEVGLIVVIRDDIGEVAELVREQSAAADVVSSPAGSAGRPTTSRARRSRLRSASRRSSSRRSRLDCASASSAIRSTRRAGRQLPESSRALQNPLGGAPGFAIGNVYVLPGLPSEMEAMFETLEEELRAGGPIGSWRRTYRTTESRIVAVLEAMAERHPGVAVGSYPSFGEGSRVEVVVKSADPEALAAATAWIETALEEATR